MKVGPPNRLWTHVTVKYGFVNQSAGRGFFSKKVTLLPAKKSNIIFCDRKRYLYFGRAFGSSQWRVGLHGWPNEQCSVEDLPFASTLSYGVVQNIFRQRGPATEDPTDHPGN
jgi:hypothetical protein